MLAYLVAGASGWLIGSTTSSVTLAVGNAGPPTWAYPLIESGTEAPPKDDIVQRVPGSTAGYTSREITFFNAPDWHPDRHSAMPTAVAHGRHPNLVACAFCHLPNGQGRPENAALAGLPAAYILRQIYAFRSGDRRSAQPAFRAATSMVKVADAAGEDEIVAAAAYYAALPYRQWVRVVQSDAAPRTRVTFGGGLVPEPGGGTAPLDGRIIEVPEDPERAELRDDASGSVAYVPPGSVERGDGLVHSGLNGRSPCTSCHGAALEGAGDAPPLAGRSPSYLFRQLYDIRSGSRQGPDVAVMKEQIAGLTDAELRDIAASLAALHP